MKMMTNKQKKYNSIKIIVIAVSLIPVILLSFFIYINGFFGISAKSVYSFFGISEFSSCADSYPLSVHFIDVGCGDSILIKCGDKTALIDTGNFSLNGKTRYYMEHSGIKKLDLFIATHTDSDHIGDFKSVADNFKIDNIWINKPGNTDTSKQTESEKIFFKTISDKNINITTPKCGGYPFGDANLQVLSSSGHYNNDNDNSLVIKLTYKNISYLFMGDAGENTENTLINKGVNLSSTVLKVSHHGSSTGTSEKFLKCVSPKYAIISAGIENKYLPNRNTVERIRMTGAKILRTDIDGNVILATDGKTLSAFCENT